MAKQQRKPPKSKPITANPLFPAVVALWFGALFGLSSAVVRVSLIETLVRTSRIDLIVPAAAPPLGITARILVALLMAALGALIGAFIGRRIARPKAEVRERKRGARAADDAEATPCIRDSHSDAPARRPISAHEEFGSDTAVSAPATSELLVHRRRALTAEPEPISFVPEEVAPLPGGQPQILDLAGAEIDQLASPPSPAVPARLAPPVTDLNAFTDGENAAAGDPLPPPAPQSGRYDGPAGERQVFAAPAALADDQDAPKAEDNALAGRQVFGMAPVEPQNPAQRQIFGSAAEAPQEPDEALGPASLPTSAFDIPQAAPLFAANSPATAPLAMPEPASLAAAAPALPAAPAMMEPLPDVANLGMTDLAVRLQESMKRRRAARAAAQAAEVQVPEEPAEAPLPVSRLPADPAPAAEPVSSAAEPAVDTPVFSVPSEIPAALRPLSFDDLADDDDDDDSQALASLLPPRASAAPLADAPQPAPRAEEEAFGGDSEEPAGDYASLLNVSPIGGRASFVRIEEPEPAGDQIEPVVIFPGQVPRVPLGGALASGAMPSFAPEIAPVISPTPEEPVSFRRFDAPTNAEQGQPVAQSHAAPGLDPEEAERSLRAALANLQRISGAA